MSRGDSFRIESIASASSSGPRGPASRPSGACKGVARDQQPFLLEVQRQVAGCVTGRVEELHRSCDRAEPIPLGERDVDRNGRIPSIVHLDRLHPAVDVRGAFAVSDHDGIRSVDHVRESAGVVDALVGEQRRPHSSQSNPAASRPASSWSTIPGQPASIRTTPDRFRLLPGVASRRGPRVRASLERCKRHRRVPSLTCFRRSTQ